MESEDFVRKLKLDLSLSACLMQAYCANLYAFECTLKTHCIRIYPASSIKLKGLHEFHRRRRSGRFDPSQHSFFICCHRRSTTFVFILLKSIIVGLHFDVQLPDSYFRQPHSNQSPLHPSYFTRQFILFIISTFTVQLHSSTRPTGSNPLPNPQILPHNLLIPNPPFSPILSLIFQISHGHRFSILVTFSVIFSFGLVR